MDNRSYGLPRRGHERLFNGERRPSGTSFDNLTFYEGRSRRKEGETGQQSPNPGEGSLPPFVLFFFRSPPLPPPPVLQTVDHIIEILSAGIFLRMLYRFTISTLNTTFHVDGLYKDHSFSTSFFYRTIFIGILFLARIDNSLFFPPF